MSVIRYDVVIHVATRWNGMTAIEGDVEDTTHWLAVDGIASDGEQCDALSQVAQDRCPKDSAVGIVVDGSQPFRVCGGHWGVHRRGRRLLFPER